MSRPLPALKPKQVIRALERAGFVVRCVRGSHYQLAHAANPALRTTVPYGTKDIKRALLRAILKDCEVTVDQFPRPSLRSTDLPVVARDQSRIGAASRAPLRRDGSASRRHCFNLLKSLHQEPRPTL